MFEPADRSAVPAARPPLNARISEAFAQLPWATSSCRRPPRAPQHMATSSSRHCGRRQWVSPRRSILTLSLCLRLRLSLSSHALTLALALATATALALATAIALALASASAPASASA